VIYFARLRLSDNRNTTASTSDTRSSVLHSPRPPFAAFLMTSNEGICQISTYRVEFIFDVFDSCRVTNFTPRQILSPYSGAYTTMHPRQANSFPVVAT